MSTSSYAVRLERKIVDGVKKIAATNRRTLKAQIEVILNAAIREFVAPDKEGRGRQGN